MIVERMVAFYNRYLKPPIKEVEGEWVEYPFHSTPKEVLNIALPVLTSQEVRLTLPASPSNKTTSEEKSESPTKQIRREDEFVEISLGEDKKTLPNKTRIEKVFSFIYRQIGSDIPKQVEESVLRRVQSA